MFYSTGDACTSDTVYMQLNSTYLLTYICANFSRYGTLIGFSHTPAVTMVISTPTTRAFIWHEPCGWATCAWAMAGVQAQFVLITMESTPNAPETSVDGDCEYSGSSDVGRWRSVTFVWCPAMFVCAQWRRITTTSNQSCHQWDKVWDTIRYDTLF